MVIIYDEEGVPCLSTSAQHQQWNWHFSKVLNNVSQCDEDELGLVRQRDTAASPGVLPNYEDTAMALDKLKNGKTAGKLGILPEMLKVGRGIWRCLQTL